MTGLMVRDLMTPDPPFVFPETEIVEAAKLMRDFEVPELIVLSGTGVVGILTYWDLVARHVAEGYEFFLVGSIMTPHPRVVAPDEPLERAALLMIEHGVGRLPVCAESGLVGVIRCENLARLGGWDELLCLLAWLNPVPVSRLADASEAVDELDASLERIRRARKQFREIERALRSRRYRLTRPPRDRPVLASARGPGWAGLPPQLGNGRATLPAGGLNGRGPHDAFAPEAPNAPADDSPDPGSPSVA